MILIFIVIIFTAAVCLPRTRQTGSQANRSRECLVDTSLTLCLADIHTHTHTRMRLSLSLSLSLYIYIYIYRGYVPENIERKKTLFVVLKATNSLSNTQTHSPCVCVCVCACVCVHVHGTHTYRHARCAARGVPRGEQIVC